MWLILVVVLILLWQSGPLGGSSKSPLDGLSKPISAALADAPTRVLRSSGLSVQGDPNEVSIPATMADPSSINSPAAGGATVVQQPYTTAIREYI